MSADEVRQYVLFRVGPEHYGLPIDKVSSIVRHETATPVPRSSSMVEGVINLRGRVIPVVSLASKLFDSEFHATTSSRIIVTESESGPVGLAVDAATEVASIPLSAIAPPPQTALTSETAEAFEGVARYGDRLIVLLDLDKALPRVEFETGSGEDLTEGDDDV